jgi:hypothetical protein
MQSNAEPAGRLTPVLVRGVPPGASFRWLALGWRDFTRAPGASLFHGVLVARGGPAVLAVTARFRDLARKSQAGRFGTFVLFFVLAFGILGFTAKQVIAWVIAWVR